MASLTITDQIRITEYSREKTTGKKIFITIENCTEKEIEYHIGLESYDGKKWHPYIFDLDTKAPLNGAILRVISPKQVKRNTYASPISYSPKTDKGHIPIIVNYRFVVNYRVKGAKEFLTSVSGPLIIN